MIEFIKLQKSEVTGEYIATYPGVGGGSRIVSVAEANRMVEKGRAVFVSHEDNEE